MDSDVFRKLCAGVKFTRKPAVSAGQVAKPSEPSVPNTDTENGNAQSKGRKRKKKTKTDDSDSKQQEMNKIRNMNRIHVSGTDITDPVTAFDQLQSRYKLHSRLLKNIEKSGFEVPTPIQMQAIPIMLDRREIMAQAPTGSGKTAAFVIPILHQLREPRNMGFRALILAPTRELAKQTLQVCRQLSEGIGFRCCYIEKASTASSKFGPKSKQNFDILVTTPNRLVYLLKHDPPLVDLSRVEWLVVDESDKLFEEGLMGFRDQLAVIYNACSSNNIRRALFSATFAHDVEEWCKLTLDNVVQVTVGARNAAAHLVQQELLFVGNESGKRLALRELIRKGIEPPVLIFVQSKDRAKELFSEFIYDGINVDVIHADRTQLQRDNTVRSFVEGKIWVLICTELMGRGIDFKGINLVINYDFPTTAVSYIHRIGRTGRAGRAGRAVTFFTEDDVTHLRSIANIMREAGCDVPEYMLRLKKPSKHEKKSIFPVKRKRIATTVYDDQENSKKRRKMMTDAENPSTEGKKLKLKKKRKGSKDMAANQRKGVNGLQSKMKKKKKKMKMKNGVRKG